MLAKSPCQLKSGGVQDIWISSWGRSLSIQERARLQGHRLHDMRGVRLSSAKPGVSELQLKQMLGDTFSLNVQERGHRGAQRIRGKKKNTFKNKK